MSSRQGSIIIWWQGWGAVSIFRQGSLPHWAFSDCFLQWQWQLWHVPWDQDCILKGFYSGPILRWLQDVLTVCFPIIVLVEWVGRVLAVIIGIFRVVACTRDFWGWCTMVHGRCDKCGGGCWTRVVASLQYLHMHVYSWPKYGAIDPDVP